MPKSASQGVVNGKEPRIHVVHKTPHWASTLVHAMSATLVITRCAPSRRLRNANAVDPLLQLKHKKTAQCHTSVTFVIRAESMHTHNDVNTAVSEHCTICIIADKDRCVYVFLQSSFLALLCLGIHRRFAASIVLQCVMACFHDDARYQMFQANWQTSRVRLLMAVDRVLR